MAKKLHFEQNCLFCIAFLANTYPEKKKKEFNDVCSQFSAFVVLVYLAYSTKIARKKIARTAPQVFKQSPLPWRPCVQTWQPWMEAFLPSSSNRPTASLSLLCRWKYAWHSTWGQDLRST